MSRIYTRKGDDGTTSMADGSRVPKGDSTIEAFGLLDEAICRIGVARPALVDNEMDELLAFVQQRLFNCSAMLGARPGEHDGPRVTAEDVHALEHAIDFYSSRLPEVGGFVLPGADEASARLHSARAGVRSAERAVVRLTETQEVDPHLLAFVNRASDVLFVAARNAAYGDEMLWDPRAEPPKLSH